MFEATEGAVSILKQMRAQVDAPETHALRLAQAQSGLAVVSDEVRSDDVTIVEDDDDRPLMIAEPAVAEQLDGHTLDFDSTSSQLVVN